MWPRHLFSPLRVALLVFALAGAAAAAMIWHGREHELQVGRTRAANLALEHANNVQRNIEHSMSATYVLGALVRQGKGSVPAFEQIAGELLPQFPAVSELALGPAGVIRNVAPLAGNEKALGFNLLQDPAQRQQAFAALRNKALTLAGPLDLVQGGVGVVGRLPVFLEDANAQPYFWGFTLAVVRVPAILRAAGLTELTQQGYAYELWRVQPDSGERQTIASSSTASLLDPVELTLQVSNENWTLSVMPTQGWGNPLGIALQATLGLLFSALLGFVAKLLLESRAHERGLETLVSQRTVELERRAADLQNFRLAMDASADAIYLVDRATMAFIDVNEAACRMQNQTREALLALGPERLLSIPREELERTYDSVIAGGAGTEPVELQRQRQDGSLVWVELRRRAQRSNERWVIVTTARDITERKQAEQALRETEQELRMFADNVPAMTAVFDRNLHLLFVNRRYIEFFGHGGTKLLGKHLREVVGEHTFSEIEGYFAQALRGQSVSYQRAGRLQNGEPGYLEVRLLPNIAEDGKVMGCYAVTTDITEHKLSEERIQHVAHHDALTGLPNRLLFADRLGQAISLAKRDSRQFALLYVDLDKFKPVNDTLGHSVGDELLQAVSERLRREVRQSDTVARVGGDEFAIILSDVAANADAEIVADKIVARISEPFLLGSQKHGVTIGASIGIAIYPSDGQEADALINAADAAMYHAKESGGNGHR